MKYGHRVCFCQLCIIIITAARRADTMYLSNHWAQGANQCDLNGFDNFTEDD